MSDTKDGYELWEYELRTQEISWKGDPEGEKRSIYFFGKKDKPEDKKKGKKCHIPPEYFVGVNQRTFLPFLTKDKEKAYAGTPGIPAK